jgi:transglutaminase-like putative cysteine protease
MVRARLLAPVTLAALSVGAALTLGRVFDSGEFALPVVGAALLPHVVGAFGRRRRWPTAATTLASAAVLLAYVVWVLELPSTHYGLPLGATWNAIDAHVRSGWQTLRTSPAPAPVTDGAVLLAVLATWAMAATADWLAFVRNAVLGALAPALVLFVWSSTLGTTDSWELTVAAFAVLAGCFVYEQNAALLDRGRSWLVTRGAVRAPSMVPTAIVSVLAVSVALLVAPVIPGAGGAPLLDFDTAGGTRGGGRTYHAGIAPLVDVGAKLRNVDVPNLFHVRSSRPDYWRVAALDEYTGEGGGQWTLDAAGSGKVEVGLGSSPRGTDVGPSEVVHQAYEIGALGERWLPAAYRPVSITLDDTLVVVSSSTLVTSDASVSGLHYEVDSALGPTESEITTAQQLATSAHVPAALHEFERLPADFPRVVVDLANDIVTRAGATTPYAKAAALRDYFRSGNFTYDTSVDLGDDANAIVAFLRVRRGFCVQFASAYAVMARAVGLPARLAVGYTPGVKSGSTYTVGSHDAHAWPEVWLAGLGWTHLFDPTPAATTTSSGGSRLPGERAAPPTAGRTQPTLPGAAVPGAAGAGTATPSAGASDSGTPPTTAALPAPSVTTRSPAGDPVWRIVGLVALGLVLAVALYAAAIIMVKRRRRSRRRNAEPALAVQGAWDEALDRLREARVARDPALTPLELARVAPPRTTPDAARPMRALARTYTTTRYGNEPPADEDARRAWDAVEELERALERPISRRERWRRRLDFGTLREPAGTRR